ncbi:MAG: metal-dependent hydrolase [Rhizonema sp. NSF051]|nr:metal-dependent hydrolase [Rhizonema sp. NSF051]
MHLPGFDITPLILIVVVGLMVLKFVGLGTNNHNLYIVIGIGAAVFFGVSRLLYIYTPRESEGSVMMSWTHIVVSATATSLILGTANPAVITVGAVSGLLPDVDISTSAAGKVLPWVSHWLERRFPHRS